LSRNKVLFCHPLSLHLVSPRGDLWQNDFFKEVAPFSSCTPHCSSRVTSRSILAFWYSNGRHFVMFKKGQSSRDFRASEPILEPMSLHQFSKFERHFFCYYWASMFEITRNLVSWDIEPLFYVFLQKGSNRRFPGVVVLRNNIAAFVSQTCSTILPQQSALRFRQGEDVPPFRLYNCVGPASKPQGFCCRHVLLIPLFDSAEQSEPLKMTSEQHLFFPFSVHVIPHIFVWGSCFW
jgi:hypothetical protein